VVSHQLGEPRFAPTLSPVLELDGSNQGKGQRARSECLPSGDPGSLLLGIYSPPRRTTPQQPAKMFTARRKIRKEKGVEPNEFEESVARWARAAASLFPRCRLPYRVLFAGRVRLRDVSAGAWATHPS